MRHFFLRAYFLLSSLHSPSCSWALIATTLSTSPYGRTICLCEVRACKAYLFRYCCFTFFLRERWVFFVSSRWHVCSSAIFPRIWVKPLCKFILLNAKYSWNTIGMELGSSLETILLRKTLSLWASQPWLQLHCEWKIF